MPRIAGKIGAFTFPILKLPPEAKKWGSRKRARIYILEPGPRHFLGAPKKRVFQNRPILPETPVNVVPKWRGLKPQFWTEGPEIGHLRVDCKMVPKYFSLHGIFSPIHLQENKARFSCLFPSRQQVLFYHLTIEFLCNKYLSILSWFWINFQCFSWLCLFIVLVLQHSLFSLEFCFFFPIVILSWITSPLVVV